MYMKIVWLPMKQEVRQRKQNQADATAKLHFSWKLVALVLFFAAITGLAVNLLDKVHYDNMLLQASSQAQAAQTELGKEQYDLKFLINNETGPINCYDLQSNFTRTVCIAHDNNIKTSNYTN